MKFNKLIPLALCWLLLSAFSDSSRPSYHQGFARFRGESVYPGLWKDMDRAWVPALGITTGLADGNVIK